MGIAVAALHMTPREFWRSTPHELFASLEVLEEMNGSGR